MKKTDKAKVKSAETKNKTGHDVVFWNNTISFHTLILFVHIIVIFISIDGNSISFTITQQDCKEVL